MSTEALTLQAVRLDRSVVIPDLRLVIETEASTTGGPMGGHSPMG